MLVGETEGLTMTTYCIENSISGQALGTYCGSSPADALDAFARDAGYDDWEAACRVAPVEDGEIIVHEVAS